MKAKNNIVDIGNVQPINKETGVEKSQPQSLPKQIVINTECNATKIAQELTDFLKKLKLPAHIVVTAAPTISVAVEVDIVDNKGEYTGKKMTVGATRALAPKETMDQGHAKLFLECINSLDKLL